MRVIEPPKNFRRPRMRGWTESELRAYSEAQDRYVRRVREWLYEQNNVTEAQHGLIGEEVYFSYADGRARYLVASLRPMTLVHLPLGDAWRLPAYSERGLTAADIHDRVRFQSGLRAMFSEARS